MKSLPPVQSKPSEEMVKGQSATSQSQGDKSTIKPTIKPMIGCVGHYQAMAKSSSTGSSW